MRRVAAYCKRHLAQEEKAKQDTDSKSYKSLKVRLSLTHRLHTYHVDGFFFNRTGDMTRSSRRYASGLDVGWPDSGSGLPNDHREPRFVYSKWSEIRPGFDSQSISDIGSELPTMMLCNRILFPFP